MVIAPAVAKPPGPTGRPTNSYVTIGYGSEGVIIPYPNGYTKEQCNIFTKDALVEDFRYSAYWAASGHDAVTTQTGADKTDDGFRLVGLRCTFDENTPTCNEDPAFILQYIIVCNE